MEGSELVIETHGIMEVWQGRFGATWQSVSPFDEEADGEPAKHSEHPYRIAIAHSAFVFIGTYIQSVMQPAFDAPALTIEGEPGMGVETIQRCATDQMDDFRFTMRDLAMQDRRLRCGGETDLFSIDFTGLDGSPFITGFIFFMGLRPERGLAILRARPRGEKPLVAAAAGFEELFSRWVDCL